ncbi:recombinase family protein [Amycolatopsis sp., V23-08]|uniref:Recombinase family protein n=1 Tax=Amycolatopsis heterodermiae TaxID=3110235 RepID=A0ABU5RM65_9PSEU|nr:recombinase family protein [Amycolatopsis sp., V23-08]MEA5366216.1 recombinase family protein [Amycolatopsis sp., V23-08]
MELTGVEVAAYERVSKDESGVERSPEEQHDGHLETCERFEWRLQTPTYREVGSASKYQRKARAAFDRLIADLKADRFTARVLMLYASNRGSRQTEEWLELINLCAKRDVVFWVEQYDRIVDPRKPRDRKQLIDDASKAELDVAEMSQNIRRTTKASARKGLPHGRIPFGYRRIYDDRTKQLIVQEPDPTEAPIVQEMYRRVKSGHHLKAIARDLNERGLRRRGGGEWVPQNIGLMLLRECYIGLRVHDPARKSAYHPLTPGASVVEGQWEALVSPTDFYSVKKILRDPARLTNEHPGAVVHLLSGLVACGTCGDGLRVNRKRKKYWRYVCVKSGCVTIDKYELETYAEKAILAYLTTLSSHLAVDEGTAELHAVQAELAEARSELDELAASVVGKRTRSRFAATVAAALEDQIEKLEAKERELQTPAALSGLIEPGGAVLSQWRTAEFSTKRALAKIILAATPDGALGLGQLQVLPIGPGRRKVPISTMHRTRFYRPLSAD